MFNKKQLDKMWATDTMDGQTNFLDGNRYAQVFSTGDFSSEIYPKNRTSDASIALKTFIAYIGVPERLTIDDYKYQKAYDTKLMKIW